MNPTLEKEKSVSILYTNWRGETAERTIIPEKIFFGSTEWHKEPQWLLHAFDVEKTAYRDFAMKDIAAWKAP
jgi:Predicted transcriptional regulator